MLDFNLNTLVDDRKLSFDERATQAFSDIMAGARKTGIAISFPDGQISAIAKVHGFAVATRYTAPFEAAGVEVINPWEGVAA